MHDIFTKDRSLLAGKAKEICTEIQRLISASLDNELIEDAKELQLIENEIFAILDNKVDKKTSHYIWRTQGDDKVRPSHAANEGKIFMWNKRPPTGHPGEDYGCRCWAEPYSAKEFVNQIISSNTNENFDKWDTTDFAKHLYIGNGLTVNLADCGHLNGIINHYFYNIYREGANTYDRLNLQIITAARNLEEGNLYYNFDNSYKEFADYFWIFGGGTVEGFFDGDVEKDKNLIRINGKIHFNYIDEFTDIFSLREKLRGTSNPEAAYLLERIVTDGFGNYFSITGFWQTNFSAQVKLDVSDSIYR
jgi:SPP1 gp7 family putative phage head morphogenesis protein